MLGQHSAAQPGAVTPTQSGELILTAIGGLWNSVTIDSGFTILDQIAVGSNFALGVGYLIQGAAATVNPTWTMTGSAQQGGANIITFK